MYGFRKASHDVFRSLVESVTTVPTTSQIDKGKISPEEFLKAGDQLCSSFPSWHWEGGDKKKRVSYLPSDKQYLVTKDVPCRVRASNLDVGDVQLLEGETEWYEPDKSLMSSNQTSQQHIPDIDDDFNKQLNIQDSHQQQSCQNQQLQQQQQQQQQLQQQKQEEEEYIPDIDELQILDDKGDDVVMPSQAQQGTHTVNKELRRYDLYISYDKYYLVPRFWLVGHNYKGAPLNSTQVLQDVMEDHAKKTITVDPHPHLNLSCAYIHPCKHSETMKKLVAQLHQGGRSFNVESYLVLFLKFIASVVPTIEYDYTMAA